MKAVAAAKRQTDLEKVPLGHRPGHRYALLTDDKGTAMSLHDDEAPGFVWLGASFTPRGSPRAFRADLEQARAFHEALGRWLADQQSPTQETAR
jgi:hypothetical protein